MKKSTAMDFMSLAGVYIILACGVAVAFLLLFIEVKYPGLLKRKPKDPLKAKWPCCSQLKKHDKFIELENLPPFM